MARYYLSQPVFNASVGAIDHQNGIIHGITVAKTGPARGHQAELDKTFLLQLVDKANEYPNGIKARFGHPNMCATALGTYLGRFHNYAYHSDKVTATLKLDPSAKETPNGNLFDYVLKMAESNPDMFGASIVFENDKLETHSFEKDGKQIKKNYFRLKALRATDIVDEPAATDGLFSENGRWLSAFTERPGLSGAKASRSGVEGRWLSGVEAPALATQMLNQNPELTEFIFSNPGSVIEFLHNYLNSSDMNLSESIKSNFRKIFALDSDVDIPEIKEEQPADDPQPESEPAAEPAESPVDEPSTSESPETEEPQLHTIPDPLTVAFGQFLKNHPSDEIFHTDDGYFFKEDNSKLNQHGMLAFMLATARSLKDELATAGDTILELNEKISASPSIPNKVVDPKVGIESTTEALDDAGKQIIKNASQVDRLKLKAKSKN